MALTYTWNSIVAGQTDSDSPINQILMDDIRENLITLFEYVGGRDYTEADNHDHDGVNSAVLGASVGQVQLKTAASQIATFGVVWTRISATVNTGYAFFPQLSTNLTTGVEDHGIQFPKTAADGGAGGDWTTTPTLFLDCKSENAARSVLADFVYVTASGDVNWVFILRDKTTKKVIAATYAEDHPCFGTGKPDLVPHPFPNFDPTIEEIIVINPSATEMEEMFAACEVEDEEKPNRAILTVILEDYGIDENSNPPWPTKEIVVGLPKKAKNLPPGNLVKPIKKKITKPDYILVKSLKKKDK